MNHKHKKKFGQNFLTDKNLLKKIVDQADIKNKNVIEIGPGKGALTQFLVEQAKSVVAFDVDKDLKIYLDQLAINNDNFKYVFKDILEHEFELNEEHHIVSNIPYNITSPIIFKILEEPMIKSATLMVQKEVSDRITSKPNNKNYNGLSVIVQYFTNVEKIMNVSKKMFNPVPKVDSAVFKMTKKERTLTIERELLFVEIVKASFHQKRKTISNNLTFSFGLNKTDVNNFLSEVNINPLSRAENITVEDFTLMTEKWPFV